MKLIYILKKDLERPYIFPQVFKFKIRYTTPFYHVTKPRSPKGKGTVRKAPQKCSFSKKKKKDNKRYLV